MEGKGRTEGHEEGNGIPCGRGMRASAPRSPSKAFSSDDADRADERATATPTATAFLVGVARETLRREANKGSCRCLYPWLPWPPYVSVFSSSAVQQFSSSAVQQFSSCP